MTHVLRRLALSRRSFLRTGSGAIALPWLDAMIPALRSGPDQWPTRSVFLFAPNGKKMDDWTPKQTGADFELPFLLQPLASLRREVSVLSHLAIDAGRAHGDGPGDHARAAASFLTCCHPRKTGGADVQAGVSIDQKIAAAIGDQTVFRSLEFGMEGGRRAGACDSGYSCAYSNNISWRTATTPMAKETHPRAAFRRMFGKAAAETEVERRDRRRLRSILDAALDDTRRLRGRLGTGDRNKLDGYLESVREIETRLQKLASRPVPAISTPANLWADDEDMPRYTSRLQLMYDLIVLALQTDQTRTVTFMLGNAGSNRSYPFLDVPEGHHTLSHHRGDAGRLGKIRKINRYHVEQFARFLGRLAQTREGDADLLHRSTVLYGSGLGDGNRHNHVDLPVLVAGRANGRFHPGMHHRLPKRTPLANVYLTILNANGVETDTFADSDGRVGL